MITTDTNILISEFQTALTEEIEYIKSQGGGIEVRARSGELEAKRGNYYFYVFLLDTVVDFPDDTPVEVRYGQKVSRGFIVSIEGLKLFLALEQHIGDKVTDITIAFTPYYLLEILRDRLNEVRINYDLAKMALGLKTGVVGEDDSFEKGQLTPSQQEALANCLGSQVAFIWGPPGTGKTYTLAHLAKVLFSQARTLAILSHTNIAIDNAMESIAKQLKDYPDYKDGKVIRFGQPQIKDLFDRFPELDLQYWVELRSRELFKKRSQLEKELEKVESTISKLISAKDLSKEVEAEANQVESLQEKLAAMKKEEEVLTELLKNSKEKLAKLKNDVKKAETMSGWRRFFSGHDLKKMENELIMLSSEITAQQTKKRDLDEEIDVLSTNIEKMREEINVAKKRVVGLTGVEEEFLERLETEIENAQERADQLKGKIQGLDQKIAQLEDDLLRQARIVGTTLTKGFTKEGMFTRRFDTVIVDEASMAPLPALFFDCGLAKEKVVIIGDFQQLPPIARAETEAVRKWLKTDVFETSGITKTVYEGGNDPRLVQLQEQHRMHPSISSLINKLVYGGRLKDVEKQGKEKIVEDKVIESVPFAGQSVVLCDTSSFDPWCHMTSSYSRLNPYEAKLALYLAQQALDAGIERIGIITPYRAQANLITKMVWDERLEKSTIDVSSVHRSQGREKEVIILDLAEGRGAPIGRPNNGKFGSEAMKIINVAISRARSKLVIIGNFKHLLSKLNEQTTLRLVLELARKYHPTVSSSEVLASVTNGREFEEEVNTVTRYKRSHIFYPKAVFYGRFYDDLEKHCHQDLVIFSPRVSRQRVEEMADRLKSLVDKGISVLVFTPPAPKQQSFLSEGKYDALELLKKIGVSVYEKPKMNATFAVIDKSIYWYGNLNILSRENSEETMTRVEGQNAAKELLRLFKVDAIQRDEAFKKKVADIKYGSCPKCGSPMIVKRGPFGMFLSCSRYPECKSTMEVDRHIIEQVYGKEYFICENCGAEMDIKRAWRSAKGRRFLGCVRYPECRFTRPL